MKLTPDKQAPALSLPLVGGGTWTLSERMPKAFSMIVVYRGLHCPICEGYLGKLQTVAKEFAAKGVDLVAISMDPQDRAEKAKTDWGLTDVPVAYGMTEEVARSWGLWISKSIKEAEIDVFPEPGTFWVRPDGRLYLIDIASMPFARPDLDLLLSRVGAMENGYPARGTNAG
ncbi:MAG: redoxin domain-containing protein [Rhodobacteraceae bacterium]|nr:redoxin domain-containing protein [Paracoccaceae bacterium]